MVCDWYVYSTLAYHSVLLEKDLRMPKILFPDYIIFVQANWQDIIDRLQKREISSKYEDIEFLKRVRKYYKKLFIGLDNVIEVDTTGRNSRDISNEILSKIDL